MLSKFVISVFKVIIGLLPSVTWSTWDTYDLASDTLAQIFNIAWYFLPMDSIFVLFGLTIVITNFRLILALIVRVKSFIPGSGGT